jgi:N6-adenosine-specific RNA methylase IME4
MTALPPGHPFAGMEANGYGCITADPPWHFRARTALDKTNWVSRRDAEKHYAVMGVDDIAALPVRDIASCDCHLFMWITGPLLVQGAHLPIFKAWGFRPSAMGFVWVKLKKSHRAELFRVGKMDSDLHVGLGMTTRKNAEFVVIGRRGSAKRSARDVREIILAPVREHSRKPVEFRERVERYIGPDVRPIAELFSREDRPGWHTWGLETGKFSGVAAEDVPVSLLVQRPIVDGGAEEPRLLPQDANDVGGEHDEGTGDVHGLAGAELGDLVDEPLGGAG